MQGTIHWLASRQVEYVESDHDEGSNGTDDLYVGFNGRWNKLADTCYSFWVTASLDVRFTPDVLFPSTRGRRY